MPRPGGPFPVQSEPPAAIESRALGTLAYIRACIDSSSSMDVPGMAGIVMGIIGVLATVLVSLRRCAPHWLAIWLIAAVAALVFGGALVVRQIGRRDMRAIWGRPESFCSACVPRCSAVRF